MDWITIADVRPYDGRYELDLRGRPLTTREWGWAKRFAGYLPVTMDANAFSDPEMVAVLVLVALHRNGKIETGDVPTVWERFQDEPFGATVTLELGPIEDEAEGDADGPPALSSNGSSDTSGASSKTTSETSEPRPSRTGSPPSATSASGPVTLAS